jgi:hypothetical protein
LLPPQHIQEELSRSYLMAVAATAGVVLCRWERDYGVDGTFRSLSLVCQKPVPTGVGVDFQLKATTRWTKHSDHHSIELPVKAYNDIVLRQDGNTIPFILVVFLMPSDNESWLEVGHEVLNLKNACYWKRLAGMRSKNSKSVKVDIPIANLLTPSELANLLHLSENGGL